MRRLLKKPAGILYTPDELKTKAFLTMLRSAPLVISVGDRVTETMQALGRTPDVQVVDEVERRVRRKAPEVPYVRLFKAVNPAGSITFDALVALERALAGEKPARVLIEGEEDLLAIPAIALAPDRSSVFYGQPGQGVVMVIADERAKASADRHMLAMRREQ